MRLHALSRGELAVGLLVSAGSVAFVSALIEVLRPYMPVLTLGVLYVFGVPHARIEVGVVAAPAGEAAYPLEAAGGRRVGTVLIGSEHALDQEAAHRFLPALASLLAVEVDRADLAAEALEAEALRRSDT